MSIIYKPEIEGAGIKKDNTKNFQNCLSILFNHITAIIKANMLFCLVILPLIGISIIICSIVMPDVNILKTGFKVQFVYQVMLIPLPFAFAGPAVAALTLITRDIGREVHVDVWDDFFKVFKRCFKKSIIVSVIEYVFYLAAFFAFMVYWGSWLFLAVTTIATLYFSIMQKYIYLMVVSLNLSVYKMFKNAFFLILVSLKKSMITLLFIILGAACLAFYILTSLLSNLLILLAVIFVTLLHFSVPRLFQNYYAFQVILENVVEPFYKEGNSNTNKKIDYSSPAKDSKIDDIEKKDKYKNTEAVTEKSEYVYVNGKLVKREIAEKEAIFND